MHRYRVVMIILVMNILMFIWTWSVITVVMTFQGVVRVMIPTTFRIPLTDGFEMMQDRLRTEMSLSSTIRRSARYMRCVDLDLQLDAPESPSNLERSVFRIVAEAEHGRDEALGTRWMI